MTADISVIICAYTEARWHSLVAAVTSVQHQHLSPREIIVVIDHNPGLLERSRAEIPGIVVLENRESRGLAGARNTGIAATRGNVVAFLDDDAVAEPDWLQRLGAGYDDPRVLGVGGMIEPLWPNERPDWFPDEFNWVVGCTYRGLPEQSAPVRNLIGANMSFRRQVFDEVKFYSGIGHTGTRPFGGSDPDFCIRVTQRWPQKVLLYEPRALVYHRVSRIRTRWNYFCLRCYNEGLSKSVLTRRVGAQIGLSSERKYTLHTLPRGALRGLADTVRGNTSGLGRTAAILAGLIITTTGYLVGLIAQRLMGLKPVQRQAKVEVPSILSRATPQRLLFVTPRYFPYLGGVQNHVYQVSRRLVRAGVNVTVLTTNPGGRLPAEETVEGIRIHRVSAWPADRDYYFAPGMYRLIKDGPWDIVHVQSYHTLVAPLAMLAAWRAGIPYVVTLHGGGHSSWLRNILRRAQQMALRPLLIRANRLIATARFEISLFGKQLRLPEERFVFIPNGGDLADVTNAAPVAVDEGLIVSIGRLERYKGHHRIIAALPGVLAQRPDARLWIAGTGPYESNLWDLARKLGVAGHVDIHAIPIAERETMTRELSKAALVVLLSEYETHPMAILEALALGRPVLVADTSGLAELARCDLTRAIPLKSTPAQVAEAVLQQLRQPHKPPHFDLPTWDECTAGLLSLYGNVTGRASCVS